jgi:phosphoglucosamine mutase
VKKLFGTDGVRGVANQELTPELAFALARAQAHDLIQQGIERPRLLIGQDTRCSSDLLACAYGAGLMATGADVVLVGVLPTPGVAYLTRTHGFHGGVMISASHNPVPDNGIKLFGSDGYKLNDEASRRLEQLIADGSSIARPTGTAVGHRIEQPRLGQDYLDYLYTLAPTALQGLKVVLDCGFGAAYEIAPALLKRLGAKVYAIHDENDGSRINVDCGSTNLARLAASVLEHQANLGLAFDGDADRCLAVDERGQEVDESGRHPAGNRRGGHRDEQLRARASARRSWYCAASSAGRRPLRA